MASFCIVALCALFGLIVPSLPIPSVHCALDYWDSVGSTPDGVWQQNVLAAFPGFCLNDTTRVIANFSDPLYAEPIQLGVVFGNTNSFVWNFVAKILIQEVIGYQVLIRDDPVALPSSTSWAQMLTDPSLYSPLADLVATTGYAALDIQAFDIEYQQVTEFQDTVLSYGTYSSYERTGIYIPSRLAAESPYDVFDWQTWSGGVDNPLLPSIWLPYSPERYAVNQEVVALFNDSWNFDRGLLYNTYNVTSSGLVCPPDSELYPELGFYAGCNNPDYPSMFVPQQCLPHPERQCAIQFNLDPFISNGQAQNQIINLNLSMVMAFVTTSFVTADNYTLRATGYNLMTVIGSMQPTALNKCNLNGVQTYCFKRLHLPDYDSTCMSDFTGSFNGSTYFCDYNPTYSYKATADDFPKKFPRVEFLLENLDFNDDDVQEMYDVYSGEVVPDYKMAACQWLQNNHNTWSTWISPPEVCGLDDITYVTDTEESCASDAESMFRVQYMWSLPKACQNGIELPSEQTFSCGYFQSEDTNAQTVVVVSSVFLFPFAIFGFIYLVICMAGIEQSKSAAGGFHVSVNLFEFTKVIQMRIRHNEKMKKAEERRKKREERRQKKLKDGDNTEDIEKDTEAAETAANEQKAEVAAATAELSYLHRFIVRYLRPFISMPILNIVGPFHTLMFCVGCMLCLYNSIIRATGGRWTEDLCWSNYVLPMMGITCISTVLICGSYQLRQNHKKMIGNRSQARVKAISWICLISVMVILIANYKTVSLVTEYTSTLDTTATISVVTCSPVPVWVGAIIVSLNCIYVITSALIVGAIGVEVLALHITSSTSTMTPLLNNSKAPVGGLYLSWGNRRFRRVNTMEIIHLKSMISVILSIIPLFALVLYTVYTEFNSPFSYNSSSMLSFRVPIDILTLIIGLCWFGPSCWHVSDGFRHHVKKWFIRRVTCDVGGKDDDKDKKSKKDATKDGKRGSVKEGTTFRNRASAVHPMNTPEGADIIQMANADGTTGVKSADTNADQSSGRSSSNESGSSGASSSSTSSMMTPDSDDANELDNLRHVLQDPLCCVILEEFAESQFDSDNIKFLLVVKSFFHELSKAPNQWILDRMKGRNGDSSNGSGTGNKVNPKVLSQLLSSDLGVTASDIAVENQTSSSLSLTLKRCIMLLSDADNICNEFVLDGAMHQLNISSTQRELVSNAMQIVKKFVNQHLQYEMSARGGHNQNNSTNGKAASTTALPSQLNYSQFAALCRQVFHTIVPEVFHLLNVNTYTRFLQSTHAQRANELISWSYAFADLNEREQNAMIQRLQIQMKWNRMAANVDSVNSSGGRGSTKMAMKEMEKEVLHEGMVKQMNKQNNAQSDDIENDNITPLPPSSVPLMGRQGDTGISDDSDIEMGLGVPTSADDDGISWRKGSIGDGNGLVGSVDVIAETKVAIPTLVPLGRTPTEVNGRPLPRVKSPSPGSYTTTSPGSPGNGSGGSSEVPSWKKAAPSPMGSGSPFDSGVVSPMASASRDGGQDNGKNL